MRLIRLSLPLVLLVVSVVPAEAARWIYQTVADGLPSNRILALAEGADGAVWAATDAGLVRRSGSWSPVSSERFTTLELGSDGVLWAGASSSPSSGRLRTFASNGAELALPPGLDALAAAPIVDLASGPAGELWIATLDRNLLRWHDPGGGFVLVEAFPRAASAVDLDETGRAWWTAREDDGSWRLWTRLAGSTQFVQVDTGDASRLLSVLALSDGSAVTGTSLGGAWWSSPAGPALALPLPPADPNGPGIVDALLEDARGRIWVGRNDTAHRLERRVAPEQPSQWALKSYSGEDGLGGDIVNAILELESGSGTGVQRQLWFGTDLGASILVNFSWAQFLAPEGLIQDQCNVALGNCNSVLSLGFDPGRDRVYFGALHGLSRLENGESWTGWVHDLPPLSNGPLLHPQVNALHVDADGTLWVATGDATPTSGGLQTLSESGGQEIWELQGRAVDAPRWKIRGIGRDADGGLWIAASDGAWRRASDGNETHYSSADGLPSFPLTALAVGPAGVTVAAQGSLARFDGGTASWTELPLSATGLPNADGILVHDLYLDDGVLVAATSAGLVVADADAADLADAVVLDPSVGFAGEVFGVMRDGAGFLLAASGSGLYRVREDLGEWVRLGAGNGLPGEDLLTVRVRDDEIYLGLQGDGAAAHRFEPPTTAITLPPPAVITSSSLPVTVQVEAEDPDSDPASVQFQWRVDELPWSPLRPDRNLSVVVGALGLADGAHRLEARARDAEFNLDPGPAAALFELDTTPPVPVVEFPGAGAVLREEIVLVGKAADPRFARYWVGVWPAGTTVDEADTLRGWSSSPVDGGELARWDTRAFEDDRWVLRVTVEDTLGVAGYAQFEVLVDNVYPFAEQTSPVLALGDRGARVHSSDGRVLLDLPTKSFTGERTLTLERESDPESEGGDAYRAGPEDLELRKRVTLSWRLEGELADRALTIQQRIGESWVPLGGTKEQQGDEIRLVVTTDRLGLFALGTQSASGGGEILSGLSAEPRLLQPREGAPMSISFDLGRASGVRAVVYSRSGRPRRVLADGRELGPGRQVLLWDGTDNDSEVVAEGLYIIAVEAGGESLKQVVTVGRH